MVVAHGNARRFVAFCQTVLDSREKVRARPQLRRAKANELAETVGVLKDFMFFDTKIITDPPQAAERGFALSGEVAVVLRAIDAGAGAARTSGWRRFGTCRNDQLCRQSARGGCLAAARPPRIRGCVLSVPARSRIVQVAASLVVLCLVAACTGSMERLEIAPSNSYASPVGFRGIRYWGDVPLKKLNEATAVRMQQIAKASKTDRKRSVCHADYLAISGGGSRGAFGAGLLAGWTKTGKRPEFEIVTGISTGSLTAPFAFLGPSYDKQLTEVYQ